MSNLDIPEVIPNQNVMKDEFGWEVPVEVVPVPSEGKVYPEGSSLNNRSTLEIKAMTAREEDILSSMALIKQGTVISHLIQACLIDKSVDVRDMLLGDRNALMVSVRITGYGSRYEAETICKSCDEKSPQEFRLSDLEIKRLAIDPARPGENVFSFMLPVTGKEVLFKFLTGSDEEDRTIANERRKKAMPGVKLQNNVTSRLEQVIVSIDGVADKNKINHFIKNMPAQDSRKLRSYITKHEPGIDMSVWMSCPHCGEESKVELPVGSNFFWPSE